MVKWTPKSEKDLDEILDHIASNFDTSLALATISEIIDFIELTLNANPLAGSVVETNPLFSKINFKGNSIYYCENPKDRNLYIVYVQPRTTELKMSRINSDDMA